MLYSLILVLSLSNASHEAALKEGLTQQECVFMMQRLTDKYKTDNTELICRNDKYTLVI